MNTRESRWLKWLRIASLYVLVTGLLPVIAVFEATQEPWRFFFDLLTWPLDGNPAAFTDGQRQVSAILGGVLCGWAWLLYQLANPQTFNPSIRRWMMQSVWIWFLVDSAGSVLTGLPLNALSNVSFLLILWVPLNALKHRP